MVYFTISNILGQVRSLAHPRRIQNEIWQFPASSMVTNSSDRKVSRWTYGRPGTLFPPCWLVPESIHDNVCGLLGQTSEPESFVSIYSYKCRADCYQFISTDQQSSVQMRCSKGCHVAHVTIQLRQQLLPDWSICFLLEAVSLGRLLVGEDTRVSDRTYSMPFLSRSTSSPWISLLVWWMKIIISTKTSEYKEGELITRWICCNLGHISVGYIINQCILSNKCKKV